MTRLKKTLGRKATMMVAAFALFGGALAAPLFMPSSVVTAAHAQTSKDIVDAAKAKGIVGEQADGYLGLVTGTASEEVKTAVSDINIRRKSYYTNLARKKNESVSDVAKVTAIELAKKAEPGQKLRTAGGTWITK